jgi:hypothetical protein
VQWAGDEPEALVHDVTDSRASQIALRRGRLPAGTPDPDVKLFSVDF